MNYGATNLKSGGLSTFEISSDDDEELLSFQVSNSIQVQKKEPSKLTRLIGFTVVLITFSFLFVASSKLKSEDHWESADGSNKKSQAFLEFRVKHGKVYESDEEMSKRYQIFINNLDEIKRRNMEEKRAGGSAVHGVTKFADMTDDEFAELYSGIHASAGTSSETQKSSPNNLEYPPITLNYANWIGVYTTPVNVQGHCGSCWAISSVEQIESDVIRVLGDEYGYTPQSLHLSPQQLLDCVYFGVTYGCNGGWPSTAFEYVMAQGLEMNVTYPYIAHNETVCKADPSQYVVSLVNHTDVWMNESFMMTHVLTTGPLAVGVNAAMLKYYYGGVIEWCGPDGPISHGVQVVGLNMVDPKTPYWIVRNSWGSDWGVDGYFFVGFGSNTCNISYYSSFTEPMKYGVPLDLDEDDDDDDDGDDQGYYSENDDDKDD